MTDDLRAFLLARIAEDEAEWTIPPRDPEHFGWWANHSPRHARRMLAECEAKRWIVNWIAGELADDPDCVMENEALRVLAAPYSAHPDFDASWGGPT
jgi:hypothetical protein